jgi:hypothetical protein
MVERLTQPCRVQEEGATRRKLLLSGKKKRLRAQLTVPDESAPANSVPAAAVIRRVQALSGFIGFKGCVGGTLSPR